MPPTYCGFCHRCFETEPHPLTKVRNADPSALLPRRAPRSLECISCHDYMDTVYPHLVADRKGKEALKQRLQPGVEPAFAEEYRAGLILHEENMNSRKRGRHLTADECTPQQRQKVQLLESSGIEKRRCLGVFWPSKIFKQKTGKAVPRRKRVVEDGVTGIVLPSDFTERIPDECTQLWGVGAAMVSKKGLASDSRDDIRDSQTNDMYAAAKRQVTL